jgi:hypothetical protein
MKHMVVSSSDFVSYRHETESQKVKVKFSLEQATKAQRGV